MRMPVTAEWKNREGLAEYAIRWNWVTGPSSSGFTAVLRVKNEARSLPWVLPGMLRSVKQTIVVDNGSTDDTAEVARRVATEAGLEERLIDISPKGWAGIGGASRSARVWADNGHRG
jgi:glycosyltransferase involved in cell wall biosynthesis